MFFESKKNQVFYVGSNDVDVFWKLRREILSKFKNLPTSGDYLHRDCYDAAKKYSKDTFIVIEKLGTNFLPTLFELKRKVDHLSKKTSFLPNNLSDKLMQFMSKFWPNHLPKRIEKYRELFEHHWIIEMSDEGIEEAQSFFKKFFKENEGDFFECSEKEGKKAILHRFTAASAFGRYSALNEDDIWNYLYSDIYQDLDDDTCPKLCKIQEYFGKIDYNDDKTTSGTETNTLLLHLRYSRPHTVTLSEEYLIYDSIGMVGSVGGTLGMFIGFSFYDVVKYHD